MSEPGTQDQATGGGTSAKGRRTTREGSAGYYEVGGKRGILRGGREARDITRWEGSAGDYEEATEAGRGGTRRPSSSCPAERHWEA
jgi:hypothetical protein